MLHLVSFLGFLTVAVSTALLIWSMIAERSDAILAALRMTEIAPALPVHAPRMRVRTQAAPAMPVSAARRRAA